MDDNGSAEAFGCERCWPPAADTAWNFRRALTCESDLIDESHFHVMVLDDFHPPFEFWPEEAGPRDEYGRSIIAARKHWLQHPELFAAEVRVHPQMSVILATRKAARS